MKRIKRTRFEELENKYFGQPGTPERDEYEFDLKMEIIGERIRQLRLQNNLTQTQLGERIGVKKAQISKLENGSHSASVSTIIKVFKAMKVNLKLKIESDDNYELAL